MRITFGAGTADLNPSTDDALRQVAREVKADPAVDLNVLAYAAGVPDDPSTPAGCRWRARWRPGRC